MKNTIVILILLLLLKPVLPVLEYAVNYNYIAKELCVNKALPQMHCNGKCHLMKELAKAAEQEKPLSEKKAATTQTEVLFYQAMADFNLLQIVPFTVKTQLPFYHNLYSSTHLRFVFRPPLFIS